MACAWWAASWGPIGIGPIAAAAAPTGVDGLLYGGGVDQLGKQLVGAVSGLGEAFVVSALLAVVVDRLIGFRVDEEHEVSGLDLVLHAESAYDFHTTSSGTRSVLGTRPPLDR